MSVQKIPHILTPLNNYGSGLNWIYGSYNSMWWAIVYAAQPSYRASRENEPLLASAIELEAERAAVAHCVSIGLLDPEIEE